MKRLLVIASCAVCALGAVFASACGEAPYESGETGTGNIGFDVYVSRVALTSVGSFQIALIENGSQYSCGELTKTCLSTNVTADKLVRVEDADGKSHPALVVSSTLTGSGESQLTTLRKVPTGADYTMVVEALSKDSPPKFLGSTCQGRITVRSGNNEPVVLNPINLIDEPDGGLPDGGSAIPNCDPRYEK